MALDKFEAVPGIVVYNNVMDDPKQFIKDLEGLIEIGQLKWFEGSTSDDAAYPGESRIVDKVRDVHAISLPSLDRNPELKDDVSAHVLLSSYLDDVLLPCIKDYQTDYRALAWNSNEGWQLLKYGVGQHFVNHVDDSKMFNRTVSMSFYLNDDYEGGEIEFPRFGLQIKPEPNQMIMFPSNYVYNHVVNPVTSGTRYAIVAWFE
jgi:hypothetical protein